MWRHLWTILVHAFFLIHQSEVSQMSARMDDVLRKVKILKDQLRHVRQGQEETNRLQFTFNSNKLDR